MNIHTVPPYVALVTRRGLWEPNGETDLDNCPLCGADRANAPGTEVYGIVVWGVGCMWSHLDHTLVCTATVKDGLDEDTHHLLNSRIEAFIEPMRAYSDDELGKFSPMIERLAFLAETSREALRDILRGET